MDLRAAIAPAPGSGTFKTVALSAWTVRDPMYAIEKTVLGLSSRSRFTFHTSLYSILKLWSRLLPPTVPTVFAVNAFAVVKEGESAAALGDHPKPTIEGHFKTD